MDFKKVNFTKKTKGLQKDYKRNKDKWKQCSFNSIIINT